MILYFFPCNSDRHRLTAAVVCTSGGARKAKSLASYVSGSRSRYVARGGTLCKAKEKSFVESADAVHLFMLGLYPHTIAPRGAWGELDSSGRTTAPLRRRPRRAEVLVRSWRARSVRLCERHGTLIENRRTLRDAQ